MLTRTNQPSNRLTAFLIAGAVTGLFGVALFGAIHAAIIVPIWSSLGGGIPFVSSRDLPLAGRSMNYRLD